MKGRKVATEVKKSGGDESASASASTTSVRDPEPNYDSSDWIINEKKQTIRSSRRNDVVRVRQLSSGPTPCVGVTIPSKVLSASGLEVGDRVYVLIEDQGRLLVEKIARDEAHGRARTRPKLVPMPDSVRAYLKTELTERVRALEADSMDFKRAGNRKLAQNALARADRIRFLIRQICA